MCVKHKLIDRMTSNMVFLGRRLYAESIYGIKIEYPKFLSYGEPFRNIL